MPNVMMTFVKAIFVPATLVKILGISADNEPMLTTLIGPNFTSLAAPGALAYRLQRRTACNTVEANLHSSNQKTEVTSL